MFMFQSCTKCINSKSKENIQMSGTRSSSQSECSAYTLSAEANSENFVNFQQRFSHFNPEAHIPNSLENNAVCEQNNSHTIKFDANQNKPVNAETCYLYSNDQDHMRNDIATNCVNNPLHRDISKLRTIPTPSETFSDVTQTQH
jgi:hypothetical protein